MTHAASSCLLSALALAGAAACSSSHSDNVLLDDAGGTQADGTDAGDGDASDTLAIPDEDASIADDAALPDAAAAAAKGPPNIVLILADDFSWNLVDAMPELKRMQTEGLTFSRYFVSDSLCCPSRTSMFTGKYPHNSGVFTNTGSDGGYGTFNARGNEAATFAVALQGQGYHTAMLGKYLNGYDPATSGVPSGWDAWAVAGNGYPEFNYDLNQTGVLTHYGKTPADYLTDVIAGLGINFIKSSRDAPFAIEFASFAPHAPYVPAPRNADDFPDAQVPRTDTFAARPSASAPAWLQAIPALDDAEISTLDGIYRKRVQSVQAIDKLIKDVRAALLAEKLRSNTYVIFTSDNGYHLGDYSLRAGKQTAFDTDIRVPLVIVGPGVPKGQVVDEVVQNVDLCPTFRALSGADDAAAINGRSLLPFLRGKSPADWRNAALVEHHGANSDPADPDVQTKNAADPPSYEALRLRDALYVEYATGEFEYHDLSSDPSELTNSFVSLPVDTRAKLHTSLAAATECTTASECWQALHVP